MMLLTVFLKINIFLTLKLKLILSINSYFHYFLSIAVQTYSFAANTNSFGMPRTEWSLVVYWNNLSGRYLMYRYWINTILILSLDNVSKISIHLYPVCTSLNSFLLLLSVLQWNLYVAIMYNQCSQFCHMLCH